jgi:DNA-binding response OmpR family regulator
MQAFICTPQNEESTSLKAVLQSIGFMVKTAKEPTEMFERWPHAAVDLVIVAVESMGEQIVGHVEQIRNQANSAIVLITEHMREKNQVLLYNAGADLVLERPYSSGLMVAQIKALMRRGSGVPYFALPSLLLNGLSLDPASRTVAIGNDEPQRLTQLEFRLLYALMTHPGQVLSADVIVESVWGFSDTGNRELVRGLVKRLRRKVESDPRQPVYIKTASGIGYYFTDQETA